MSAKSAWPVKVAGMQHALLQYFHNNLAIKKANLILGCPDHPLHEEFDLFSSECHFWMLTHRQRKVFFILLPTEWLNLALIHTPPLFTESTKSTALYFELCLAFKQGFWLHSTETQHFSQSSHQVLKFSFINLFIPSDNFLHGRTHCFNYNCHLQL